MAECHAPQLSSWQNKPTVYRDEWPCLGAISIDKEHLLVLWGNTWYFSGEYHSLRANGHKGWLEYALLDDQLLIAWEPTLENKSVQDCAEALLVHFSVEVRRDRTGLLGYVAAKDIDDPSCENGKRLAFLAYWKTTCMTKQRFFSLQGEFSSYRGHVVHKDGEKVWVQWEPTWVYYENVDREKKGVLYALRENPQALLDHFYRKIVYYSTALQVEKRLASA
jgi:hypothetical protein